MLHLANEHGDRNKLWWFLSKKIQQVLSLSLSLSLDNAFPGTILTLERFRPLGSSMTGSAILLSAPT